MATETPATVLVVEDEDAIRQIIGTVLELRGLKVLSAADSAEALQQAQQHAGRIDLVITDLQLPGLSGDQLVSALLPDRPEIHVIYMSGNLSGESTLPKLPSGKAEFLHKPFTPRQLTEVVGRMLG